ncbi:MAG TPA: carotenoid 1,2-hydratase [Burkholderiaceae bacterium]
MARTLRAAPAGLSFPADFGAHPASHTEWWYVTGSLQPAAGDTEARLWGFQATFFRSLTGLAPNPTSHFAATELVFAHAALSDLGQQRLLHDQRIARSGFGIAQAAPGDTDVVLRDWQLKRSGDAYRAVVASETAGFALDLALAPTQSVLLQGEAGLSRKGPAPESTSRYYSEPQLAVRGTLTLTGTQRGPALPVTGRAWLDHEWSDSILPKEAVGWDWIGMNLDDGSALTAFRLRRADGTALYAGGSFRAKGGASRNFEPDEVVFTPGRLWQSAASKARYPVRWQVKTPAGTFEVAALLDAQELDSRQSTGSFYWEGLSDLLDARGQRVGRGYLEMTGYASRLAL